MTIQELPAEVRSAVRRDRHWSRALVVLTLLAVGAGFIGGAAWTRQREDLGGWHTAVGYAGTKEVSIAYDGWTYGASGSVDSWVDREGTWHAPGWPQCLRVPPGSRVTLRFQARVVTIDGTTTRPIVAIGCDVTG